MKNELLHFYMKTVSLKQLNLLLYSIIILILGVLITGGITRLTHSGLSIADWNPIMGIIPPLSDQDWQKTFKLYQQTPEYLKVNWGISLDDFKDIFFWEYLHRLLARMVGIWLICGWGYLYFTKKLSKSHNFQLVSLLVLGSLQGALGWFMVQSGLIDNPFVSHFRLAAHLTLALLVMATVLYIIEINSFQYLKDQNTEDISKGNIFTVDNPTVGLPIKYLQTAYLKQFSVFTLGLLLLTIVYGAFTAGTRAGFIYNTFPFMDGKLIPDFVFSAPFRLEYLVSHPAWIQLIHRFLAIVSFLIIVIFYFKTKTLTSLNTLRHSLLLIVCLQVTLGILTLILKVPVTIATLHQLGAAVLFLVFTKITSKLFYYQS